MTSADDSLTKMELVDDGSFPWEGEDQISDSGERAIDLDGKSKLNLFRGYYDMGRFKDETLCTYRTNVMIRKGSEIKKYSFDLLKDFQHNYAIPLLNFYSEGTKGNMGRLVIPEVKGSFAIWVKLMGAEHLFDKEGKISILFSDMIINLCDLIDKLHQHHEHLMIQNLNLKNLYMADEANHRVLLLLTEVEICKDKNLRRQNWISLKEILEWCCEECSMKLDILSSRYIRFIGSEKFSVNKLKKYPLNWDYETKEKYLMMLIAAPRDKIKKGVDLTNVSWPLIDGKLPQLFQQIVNAQCKKGHSYETKRAYDYILFLRDSFKHFYGLPWEVKNECGNDRRGIIKLIDQWSPGFWADLYDIIGWPHFN